MKNRILYVFFLFLFGISVNGQTFHSLIFSDMKEQGREADRINEMNNMIDFQRKLSNALGFKHDLYTFSDVNFTSTAFESKVKNLSVNDGDIVFFYYNGHGVNWDDDDWPHMSWRDKQYWETKAFNLLNEYCGNAKLIICMASCCNMDSRNRATFGNDINYGPLDNDKVKALFTQFNGQKAIITSSSKRGQFSFSWQHGSIYGVSFREAVDEVLSKFSNKQVSWDVVLDTAKKKALSYSSQKQEPQYKILPVKTKLSERASRTVDRIMGIKPSQGSSTSVDITSVQTQKNVSIQNIPVFIVSLDFSVTNLSDEGGMVVAFFYDGDKKPLKDQNGKYKSTNGDVSIAKNFGSHSSRTAFSNYELLIPMEELHITDWSKPYFVKIGIYDYKSKKYIVFSDYIKF